MNINVFTTGNANIYPMVNSRAGGQLATEFNTRSRETVGTDPAVSYSIGHSFTHSEDDFKVSKAPIDSRSASSQTSSNSSTVLVISPGRAIVNGHYLECLTELQVDVATLNMVLVGDQDISEKYTKTTGEDEKQLSGKCCIGLRAFYSGDINKYGSLIAEHYPDASFADDYSKGVISGDLYYNGIQIVVLNESDFKLPSDGVPEGEITAHLKLATFEIRNGVIVGDVCNNPDKIKYIDVSRLVNAESLVNETYPSTAGLNLQKHYVMSPTSDGKMGWCDATDNLKNWKGARFLVGDVDTVSLKQPVQLHIPPKPVDGVHLLKAADIELSIPVADFTSGTPGTVDKQYTDNIKSIKAKVDNVYNIPNGKYRYYISELSDRNKLPLLNPNWGVGDYVVVGRDLTVSNSASSATAPSTMYMILPGTISKVAPIYIYTRLAYDKSANSKRGTVTIYFTNNKNWKDVYFYGFYGEPNQTAEKEWPCKYPGVAMKHVGFDSEGSPVYAIDVPADIDYIKFSDGTGNHDADRTDNIANSQFGINTGFRQTTKGSKYWGVETYTCKQSAATIDEITRNTDWTKVTEVELPTASLKSDYILDELSESVLSAVYGSEISDSAQAGSSYIVVYSSDQLSIDNKSPKYIGSYLVTETNGNRAYSDPIHITGEISLASADRVGGFYNFDESMVGAIDNGYVKLNDQGYLQLVDYPLLRAGVLAYQLGQSIKISAGVDVEAIQSELDNYVNRRVAFVNAHHLAETAANGLHGALQNVIDVYLPLSDASKSDGGTIEIYEIDSRFSTPVCIHISGEDLSKYIINISDCQRIRLIVDAAKPPQLNLYRSCLYYDANILDMLYNVSGLSLWYHTYSVSGSIEASDYESDWINEPDIVVDEMTVKRSKCTSPLVTDITADSNDTDIHYELGLYSLTFNQYGKIIGAQIAISSVCTKLWEDSKFTLIGSVPLPMDVDFPCPTKAFGAKMSICGRCVHSYRSNSGDFVVTTTDVAIQIESVADQLPVCNFTFRGEQETIENALYAWSNNYKTLNESDLQNWLPGMSEDTQILSGGVVLP